MFSLFQTVRLWNIHPQLWLTAYLEACAQAGGQAPPDLESSLPWNLPAEPRMDWALNGEEAVSPNPS
jgi:hypothetical protein